MTKVAIATPAKASDYGWNQQGLNGAKAAAATNGAKLHEVTNIGYNKTENVLRQLAQGGADFIIAHASGYDTIAARIAQQYNVPTITYDVPTNLKKGQVSYVTTSSQEGAYLAGILAAHTTKTHKVGIIISASDDNWYKMSGGFAAGFRSIDKTSKIFFATISPTGYDDAAGGKRVAQSIIAQGADVIFAMGDDASFGYLQAISTAKAGPQGLVHRRHRRHDADRQAARPALVGALELHRRLLAGDQGHQPGTYGTHGYNLTLENGGISLLHSKYIPASRVVADQRRRRKAIEAREDHDPGRAQRGAVQKLSSRHDAARRPRRPLGRARASGARTHAGRTSNGHTSKPTAAGAPIVEMVGITKRYPGVLANDDVSFTVSRGEVQCLLGENGAGKSTLIGILSGLVRPDAGTIRIDGRGWRSTRRARRSSSGSAPSTSTRR